MTQDVIQVPFVGVAARKLHDLFERGYTVCGVAIQRIHQSGNFDRGAITTGGMVMWWQKLFSGDELEASNVQHPSNALQLAEALHEMANTYLSTGGDFVPGPRSKADELIDEAASELRRQHARIEDLEAQLYAIGAGGVGQSIKPQVQADIAQEPVAWRVRPFDYGIGYEGVDALTTRKEQCEMWERKGWKVEPLYTAPQPARQPLTDEQILSIVRVAPALDTAEAEWLHVARAIEAAYGITKMVPVSQMLEALRTKYSDLIYESNQKMAVHFEEDIFTINEFLQRIQQEAAAKEREACALLVEKKCAENWVSVDKVAAAIRARSKR